MKIVAAHLLVCFYLKKIKIFLIIFITALKSYDLPCSPMDTTDDVNVFPQPLAVNPSDQSEIPHGTAQPEPENQSTSTSFVLHDPEGTLPEYVNAILFKILKFCNFNYFLSVILLLLKHRILSSNQAHNHRIHHPVVRTVFLIRHKLKSVSLL